MRIKRKIGYSVLLFLLCLLVAFCTVLSLSRHNSSNVLQESVHSVTQETAEGQADGASKNESIAAHSVLVQDILTLAKLDGAVHGIFLAYPDESDTPILQDDKKMRSASMIKVFILADAMEQVKAGQLSLSDKIVLRHEDKVGGSGILSGYPDGTSLSLEKLLTLMITESDNTATNLVIQRLGIDSINQYMQAHGYVNSSLQRKMMDADAVRAGRENYTSAKDLGIFFSRLYHSSCVGGSQDEKMREILFGQTDTECFPQALPNVKIAHKTGELDRLYSDGGIIYGAAGEDMVLVVLSDGYENRAKTIEMMRKIARRAFHR